MFFVAEIEDCYRERALKLNEIVIAYGSGKISKHDKGNYKFNLTSPDDISSYWSESPYHMDLGICYTLKLNDTKNGFYFFFLDTNLTYTFVLHDYNFYVNTPNPLTFPRILQIVRLQKISCTPSKIFFQEKNLAEKKGKYKWFYTQLTEHKLLNRENRNCETSSDYNWQACIFSNFSKTVGCKLPWDKISDSAIKACDTVEKILQLKKLMEFSIEAEQNELVYETSCPIPCSFKEYRKVGDSLTGDNIIFESKDERFER